MSATPKPSRLPYRADKPSDFGFWRQKLLEIGILCYGCPHRTIGRREGGGRGRHGRGQAARALSGAVDIPSGDGRPDGRPADCTGRVADPGVLRGGPKHFFSGYGQAATRRDHPAECLARKRLSKPLKRLKMDSDRTRRFLTRQKPRAATLAGRRVTGPGAAWPAGGLECCIVTYLPSRDAELRDYTPSSRAKRGDPEERRAPTVSWIATSPCGLLAMTALTSNSRAPI